MLKAVLLDGSFATRALVVVATVAGAFAACAAPAGGPNGGGPNGGGGSGSGATGSVGGSGVSYGNQPGGGSGGSGVIFNPGDQPDVGVWVPPTGDPECTDPPPSTPPPLTLLTLDECTGKVDAATQTALEGGGSTSGARILYPYDGTVFPAGLVPPEIQWEQTGSVSAVRIHITSQYLDYTGCFGSNSNYRLTIPQEIWDQASDQSRGGTDPMTVELTTMSGGTVMGPLTFHWTIARGNLQGTLYYNTYTSPQAANNGAVMRLRLGATQPEVLLTDVGIAPFGPCWSCHSLSANGATLVAQHHQYPGGPYLSGSFDLAGNPGLNPPTMVSQNGATTFEMGLGAVSPDGTKVLTMGSPSDSTGLLFPDGAGNIPAMIGPKETALVDVKTGQPITMTGFNVDYAKMPQFSPDGTKVVFNWHEDSLGHSLGVADFDQATNTASNVRRLYKHDTLFPGWPFFTPDNKDVIFVLGNAQDFVSSYPNRIPVALSDLYIVDVETGAARNLYGANGYPSGGGATYLPRPGRDEHYVFFPTVSPAATGGYFWLFFTSRRTYGNKITQIVDDAPVKKIWVSAIAIRGEGDGPIADPSFPPFYLPGQEEASGNIRAFATLDACKADGGDCDTGLDCCDGHCYQGSCGLPPPGDPICNYPPPPACSELGGRCNVAEDCCDAAARCLLGYCTIVEPPR